ncbi:DUF6542 domain-containing protein [Mycolicibacterium sp. Dal123E01]|uniref:DUF6542 domain-containing protein n=1 Tax=Mycolicibacterium sp. Dal123E01 TaxID=3457578 RepID=UPI00403EC200
MSAQRARSSVAAANRSAHPNLRGVPWWGAVLIAVIATTIGFAFDAGSSSKDLGNVFGALYAVGCVAAVLAVRQSSIFTAVIQPPLILFVAVPSAYFLFHGAEFTGIKDTLINFGYPLIERFPLMLFTSAGVLLIGLVRWYFAMSNRSSVAAEPTDEESDDDAAPGLLAALVGKVTALMQRGEPADDEDADEEPPRRKHSIDRPATSERRPRSDRPTKRPAPTRSRHARPPLEDITEAPERPRRASSRRRPDTDDDPDFTDIPRRRRQPRDPNGRPPSSSRREPREPRESREPRVPRERRDPYVSPPPRGSRFEPYEPYPSYEPYPPYEPPPRQRPSSRTNADSGTHHPVSRVRYRGDEDDASRQWRDR